MKVVFETNCVLPKLSQVASVINSKNNIPILGDVCFTVNADSMILTGSDGELWVTERVEILDSDTNVTFCVSAQDIIKCLSSLKDEVVTMTLDEEKKTLTCDYGRGNINIPYESAEEYPRPMMDMNESYEIILPSSSLRNAIELTQTAIANDELRPIMNGIHFDFIDSSMTCNTCNFLKMVKYRKTFSTMNATHAWFTLPKKPSSLLQSILSDIDEDVKLRFTSQAVSVSNKDFKVTARLLEGNYPDCDRIIPQETTIAVEVDSNEMVQALRHVLTVDNSGNLVTLTFVGNEITVSAEDITFGRSATETIKCINNTQEEFSICFSGVALTEMLKNISDDKVVIEMVEPKKPAIIYAKSAFHRDEYMSLIMPMVKNPVVQPQK